MEIHPQPRGAAAQIGKILWTVLKVLMFLCMKQQLLAPAKLRAGELLSLLLVVPGVLCAIHLCCTLLTHRLMLLVTSAGFECLWCGNYSCLLNRHDIFWCKFGIRVNTLNQKGCILPSDIHEWSNWSNSVHLYTISIGIGQDKVCVAGRWDLTRRGLCGLRLGSECEASCHKRVKAKNILQSKWKQTVS